MNVSLPVVLREFVDDQVATGLYGTASEYVRELIRRDRQRLEMRQLIVEGIASPEIGELDGEYWAAKSARLRRE